MPDDPVKDIITSTCRRFPEVYINLVLGITRDAYYTMVSILYSTAELNSEWQEYKPSGV